MTLVAFIARFVIGGVIVAALPLVAQRFGSQWAGVLAVMPLLTLVGFAFIALSEGGGVLRRASSAALIALPAMGVYLITVYGLTMLNLRWWLVLIIGLMTWVLTAALIARFTFA